MTTSQQPPEIPAHAQLTELAVWGHHKSRLLEVAVKLELADHLAENTLPIDELARLTATHPRSLYRLLRGLCGLGILQEDEKRHFSLTTLGSALRKGASGAARASILMMSVESSQRAWDLLLHAVRTGETAFVAANGEPFFEYVSKRPEEIALFSETMVNLSASEPPAVASAYDFSVFNTIVDVGGATGNLLAAILERYPQPGAILCDLPEVLASAPALLQARGVDQRVQLQAADFFTDVPAGGDVYLLSHVVHDWTEDKAIQILQNCRKAMPATARLLLIEMVMDGGSDPLMSSLLDISMLVYVGGEERTEMEYRDLLARSGFELIRIIPTSSNASIIEAKPC